MLFNIKMFSNKENFVGADVKKINRIRWTDIV